MRYLVEGDFGPAVGFVKLRTLIIVVEDDDRVRALVEDLLLDRGYDVITARNGPKASARYSANPVCLC